jgi:GTPase involved in cell partitioning and DNA repair
MLIQIVKKYWFEIAFVLVTSILIIYANYLRDEVSSLEKDNAVLQSKLHEANAYLNTQNAAILANKADYNVSMAKLPQELHKIDTRYITKTVEVIKWRDRNETQNDCNASIQYLNNYQF